MSKETYMSQMKTILENAAQEGYKNGIADGLSSAHRIHLWWSVNHQLKEPHSTEKLNEWSQGELEKLKLKLGDRTDIQVFDTHVRCDGLHQDQRSTAGQMAEMISMFRPAVTETIGEILERVRNPQFSRYNPALRTHDWRKYIDDEHRSRWHDYSMLTRLAVVLHASNLADQEDYE